MTTPDSLWQRVDKRGDDECWPWLGALTHGYGPHRAAYELLVGPIPEGLQLDHLCHTRDIECAGGFTCPHRRCVNPAHLEPVTTRENLMRSRVAIPAVNARKTHCPQGHPYAGDNLRYWNGQRVCLTCRDAKNRRRRPDANRAVELTCGWCGEAFIRKDLRGVAPGFCCKSHYWKQHRANKRLVAS